MTLQKTRNMCIRLENLLVVVMGEDPPGCIGQRSQERLDILFEIQGETFIFQSYAKSAPMPSAVN